MMNRFNIARQRLAKLNLFDTESTDEHSKRNEILSTRVYIIILIVALCLVALYTSLQSQTNIITIPTPTQKQYEELTLKFSNNLQCPCKYISIPYEQFINIIPKYYQICSSDFISQKWIDYLFYKNTSYFFQLDFRHDASSRFQILRTLCEQAQRTIDDSLNEFYLLQFITNELVSTILFDVQIESFVALFKGTTPSSFQNLLKLIRQTTIANGLLSAIETTFVYAFHPNNISRIFLDNIYYYENSLQGKIFDCYCDNFTACQNSEGIYANIDRYDYPGSDWPDYTVINGNTAAINATFIIPGMVVGCKPTESLLRSTSECLFEQTCLHQIASYINYSSISIDSFTVLNQSQSTRNITIEVLANNLFVEEWIINKSYENYFDYCQPLFCHYTDDHKQGFVQILAIMISLYGGLRVVLRFIIPNIVKFIRRKKRQQHPTNVDINSPTIISLVVFCAYISSEKQSKTIFVYNPTRIQFKQLKNQSVNDLQCPCSKISIKYSEFINFDPTYHQVCSSVFVSDLWYNGYVIWNISKPCNFPSFANLASYYFSLLSTFCQSANETILNGLTQFYAFEYVTSEVVLENQFNSEVMSFIELFKTRTQNSFKAQWNLMQSVIFNNQIATVRRTNVIFYVESIENTTEIYSQMVQHNNCTCGTNSTCHENVAFCDSGKWNYIIGMYIGCYMVDSLLISTTECFFDETCINIIKSYVVQSTALYQQLNILNVSKTSQYKTSETIGTIVENLFIENWTEFYSYENYYNQCKPSFCSYTIQIKFNFIYILTRLIGVHGGLTIVIQFLIPNIVNLIRRKKRQQQPAISISNRMNLFFQSAKTKLFNLNLFQDRSTNHEKIRKQILTTRLYLILFVLILFILVLYTSLNRKSITVNVPLLSLIQYQQLEMKYKTTLTCPCNGISIEYKEFVDLKSSYHEICSSDFVSQLWFNYLYNDQRINDRNFRATASAQFQALASLCKLTEETMNTSLTQFYSTKLISGQLISNETFQKQVDSIVNIFQKSIPQTFKRTLDMIHGVIHGNFYMSTYQTNWKFTVVERKPSSPLYTNPLTYNNTCDCGTSSKCSESIIFSNSSIIEGLVIGCYPVESMLQSSLQCLYNQTCLEILLSYFQVQSEDITFKILSSINQYGIDEKVEHMVDRFFVDQWFINRSYENYFQQCHSTFCTYSYIQNFNIFYIITTILGLYGGLTITLKLLIPFIIHIIFRLFCRRRISVAPSSQTRDEVTS